MKVAIIGSRFDRATIGHRQRARLATRAAVEMLARPGSMARVR